MRAVLAMTLLTLVAELPVAAQTSRPSVAESRGGLEALIETARVSEQEGRIQEAIRAYESARSTADGAGDHATAARMLVRLARAHITLGAYDEARAFIDRARELSQSLGDEPGIGRAQQAEAWVAFWTGHRDEGIETLAHASRLLDSVGPPPDAAACHADLSSMLLMVGKYDRAVEEATRGISAYEALNDRFRVAFARGNRAAALVGRLDFAAGITEHESALKDLLALDRKAAAATRMMELAVVYATLGRHADSARSLDGAREIYERLGDRRNLAAVAAIRARTLTAFGRYREALDEAEAALPVLEAVNPAAVPIVCELIGLIQQQLMDPDAARASYERAVAEFERMGDHEAARKARVELAYVAQTEGGANAIDVYEDALARSRENEDRPGAAAAMWKLGAMCFDLGRLDEAASWLAKSAEESRALGLTRDVANALSLLARVHCEREHFQEALSIAEEALAIEERFGERGNIGRTLAAAARAQRRTGAPRESIVLAKRAIEVENEITAALGDVEGERLRSHARDASDEGLLATLEDREGTPLARDARIKDALWFIEQSRSRVLGQTLASRHVVLASRASLISLSSLEAGRMRLDAAQKKHDALRTDSSKSQQLPESTRELEAAKRDWGTAIARVHREARRVADLVYPRPVELDALLRALPPRTAFVAFQITRERVLALAIDPSGSELVDLGPQSEIVPKVESYARFLSSPTSAEEVLSRALYDLLLRPIERVLLRNERLLVSPDGALSVLSFEALKRQQGAVSERVVERWSVTCVPSGTVLEILRNDKEASASGDGVLALGDPIYPAEESAAAASRAAQRRSEVAVRGLGSLERLPGSGEEAQAVAELVPEGRRVLLLRAQATRERLIEACRGGSRFRTIHLACHGIVDTERPRLSGIVLGGGAVLCIDDLFGMNIPADLTVLSACETAGISLARGEGMIGLARGFMAAGCPRVIASNWKVADTSTRDLMVGVHRRILKENASPDVALRTAKLERLRGGGRLAHPYYWAAFVLWGLPD